MCLTFRFLYLCDEDRAHVCSPLAALPLWPYLCSQQTECSAVRQLLSCAEKYFEVKTDRHPIFAELTSSTPCPS